MKCKTPKSKRSKIKPINKRFNFHTLNYISSDYDLSEKLYIHAGMLYNKPAMQAIAEIVMQLLA